MTITRDIIIDLLPLYAAGEASADSRAAVEHHLASDPALAALLRELQEPTPPSDAAGLPDTLEKEVVTRTRRAVSQRGWTLGLALWLTLLPLTIAIGGGEGEITFFLVRDMPQLAWLCWAGAALLWFNYVRLRRRLRAAGL